jgi:hypothetical protein
MFERSPAIAPRSIRDKIAPRNRHRTSALATRGAQTVREEKRLDFLNVHVNIGKPLGNKLQHLFETFLLLFSLLILFLLSAAPSVRRFRRQAQCPRAWR